jgi:sugar transferase EpsL
MRSRNPKRLLDLLGASVLLVILSPVMLGVALLVSLEMGSPVIFHQIRPGLHGRSFVMHKFRTMLDLRDEQGNLLPDEQRLTKYGRLIRKLSLDEIPELWNVLKGDMSLVGPRPLLREYLSCYTPEQARRHDVKPGITGWALVNGRNMLTWNEKFKLDVWYVENQNFWLDLKIIALTVWKVLRREGVSFPGYETMPKFTGEKR